MLTVLLPWSPKCWDYRRAPPHPVKNNFDMISMHITLICTQNDKIFCKNICKRSILNAFEWLSTGNRSMGIR
jgi:hypothetical protein